MCYWLYTVQCTGQTINRSIVYVYDNYYSRPNIAGVIVCTAERIKERVQPSLLKPSLRYPTSPPLNNHYPHSPTPQPPPTPPPTTTNNSTHRTTITPNPHTSCIARVWWAEWACRVRRCPYVPAVASTENRTNFDRWSSTPTPWTLRSSWTTTTPPVEGVREYICVRVRVCTRARVSARMCVSICMCVNVWVWVLANNLETIFSLVFSFNY